MRKNLGLLSAVIGLVLLSLAGCASGITEPLSASELREVANSVSKPGAFTKLSKLTSSDFVESYGDLDRVDETYENTSEECSSIAELESLTRWAEGGEDYKKFFPTKFRGFNDINGFGWRAKSAEDADVFSYARVTVAIMSFDDEESALSYTALISENVEDCFDFRTESDDILQEMVLTDFDFSEENTPDFSYEYTEFIEISGYFDISLATDEAIGVFHFGPNVAIVGVASDEDSRVELGVTTSDLVDGFEELRQVIEAAIEEVQAGPAPNA